MNRPGAGAGGLHGAQATRSGTARAVRAGVDICADTIDTPAGMRLAIVTAGLIALATAGWAADTAAPAPPKCSALSTQRHGRLVTGPWNTGGPGYVRYCGPGRAVLRVGGTSFHIKGGTCRAGQASVRFGLLGYGGLPGRGFIARLQPAGTDARPRWYLRPGRIPIIDGEVQLPGFQSLPHQGTAIVAKDLQSATFSLGDPARPRITGSWTCR